MDYNDLMARWYPFPDPAILSDGSLVLMVCIYGYALYMASNFISDGSELLLLVPRFAPIIGSVVLPVLGAVPDSMMIFFSGMGPNAQEEVAAGVGALAGSTVMLLTIPWFVAVFGGRVTIEDGVRRYKRPRGADESWEKLKDGSMSLIHTGVSYSAQVPQNAKLMLITMVSYFVIQIPALFVDKLPVNSSESKVQEVRDTKRESRFESTWALLGFVFCVIQFFGYLLHMWRSSQCEVDEMVVDANILAIREKKLTLRGAMANFRGRSWASITSKAELEQVLLNNESLEEVRRMCKVIAPFFAHYDRNGDNQIDFDEFRMVFKDVNENISREAQEQMFNNADLDCSGSISFEEFVACLMSFAFDERSDSKDQGNYGKSKQSPPRNGLLDQSRDDEESDEEEEEEDIPEDLADLAPEEQQRRIKMRSAAKMAWGTALVLAFSGPTVDIFNEMGVRTGVPVFYISFVLAPIASNASELVAAYNYAQKRTMKSMTTSLSTLCGAGIMNNTFCLGVFLGLIYFNELAWKFTAETACIVFTELFVGANVIFRQEQRLLDGLVIICCYPVSLGLVYVLEYVAKLD